MADSGTPLRSSRWWVAGGLIAAIGIAWAVGAYGSRATDTLDPSSFLVEVGTADFDLPEPERISQVEWFWRALGSGDSAAVAAALDPEAGTPLGHYAGFATEFEAGFEPENCRAVATDAIRCTLRATNTDLIDLYWPDSGTTEYVTSASVTISDRGIDSLQLPGVINSASLRLLSYAREVSGMPADCDRIHHNAQDLPPFNTTMAQTAACARALVLLLPDALAARG